MRRIVRAPGLPALTGYTVAHIYDLIAAGEFPKPIPLGKRAVGWLEDEIADWQGTRIAARKNATEGA